MALDKEGNIDVDKTVDGMIDDILPPLEEPDDKPDPETPEVPEVPETPETSETPEVPETPETPETPAEPVEAVKAPQSWSKEMHPEFSKLPAPIQSYIAKREEDYTRGISQYKQAADYGTAVNQVVHPYMAHIQSRGVDVPTALKFLLNADYTLTRSDPAGKAAFFTQLMKDYGVDQSLLGQPPEEKTPVQRQLEERLAKTEGTVSEFTQRQTEAKRAEIMKSVDAFAADPKNIYFKELSDDIIKFINVGYTLQDAYGKAVWANEATRAKELVRTSKEAEATRKKAADEAAAKAKKAARSNVKDTPSDKKAPTGLLGSMDDTLRSTYRSIQEKSN